MNRRTVEGVLSDGEKLTLKRWYLYITPPGTRYVNLTIMHPVLSLVSLLCPPRSDKTTGRMIRTLHTTAEIWGASDPAIWLSSSEGDPCSRNFPEPLGESGIHLGDMRTLKASDRQCHVTEIRDDGAYCMSQEIEGN
jgi:hypothetical protein